MPRTCLLWSRSHDLSRLALYICPRLQHPRPQLGAPPLRAPPAEACQVMRSSTSRGPRLCECVTHSMPAPYYQATLGMPHQTGSHSMATMAITIMMSQMKPHAPALSRTLCGFLGKLSPRRHKSILCFPLSGARATVG